MFRSSESGWPITKRTERTLESKRQVIIARKRSSEPMINKGCRRRRSKIGKWTFANEASKRPGNVNVNSQKLSAWAVRGYLGTGLSQKSEPSRNSYRPWRRKIADASILNCHHQYQTWPINIESFNLKQSNDFYLERSSDLCWLSLKGWVIMRSKMW